MHVLHIRVRTKGKCMQSSQETKLALLIEFLASGAFALAETPYCATLYTTSNDPLRRTVILKFRLTLRLLILLHFHFPVNVKVKF